MTRHHRTLTAALALAAAHALWQPPVLAQNEIVIYRCVDPSGAVSLQNNAPCPKGSQQTIRKVGAVQTAPPPKAATPPTPATPAKPPGHGTASTEPTPPQEPTAPPPLERKPPPALFQCRTWDEREYFGDTDSPPGKCVPVQSVGIDGSAALAAGETCEMRYDACIEIPQAQLCQSWKKRVDEAEFRWKFSNGNSGSAAAKAEYERLSKLYRDSTCVGG